MSIFSKRFKSFSKKAILPLIFVLLLNIVPASTFLVKADEVSDLQQEEVQLYLEAQRIREQMKAEAEALRDSLRPPEPQPEQTPAESQPIESQPADSSTSTASDQSGQDSAQAGSSTGESGSAGLAGQTNEDSSQEPASSSSEPSGSQPPSPSSGGSGTGGVSIPFENLVRDLHGPTTEIGVTTEDATITPPAIEINNQGEDSVVLAENVTEVKDEVTTDNKADVTNTRDIRSDSGNNTISCSGICEGKLTTGSATTDSSSGNKINTSNVSSGGSGAVWPWMRYGTGPQSDIENGGEGAVNIGDNTYVRDLAIIQKNDALLKNEYNVVANTGGNDLLTTFKLKDFDALTGEARSRLTLLNMVNTNLLDSEWWPLYIGIDKEFGDDINLLDELLRQFGATAKFNLFDSQASATITNSGEDAFNKVISDLQVKINANSENSGLIHNKITVAANSGHNTASSPYKIKDLNLTTGDSEAALTLLNFLNTYLVNSQWVTTVINVFGKWTKDLILPSPSELLDSPHPAHPGPSVVIGNSGEDAFSKALVVDRTQNDIFIKNDLNVKSKVQTVTSAGDDFIGFVDEIESSSVVAGDAKNLSSQFLLGNTVKVGGGFFNLFVNDLSKQWSGSVEGVPQDAQVQRDEHGAVVIAERGHTESGGEGAEQGDGAAIDNSGDDAINVAEIIRDRNIIIQSSNNGSIVNDVKVMSISGENIITGLDGRRINVKDGNARTATTIGNVVNTTMIGAKAMNVIVNVFGEWTGKVVFGKAVDLLVTLLSSAGENLQPGQEVSYTASYENASEKENTTNAQLKVSYDHQKMELIDSGGATETSPGLLEWGIGAIEPKGTGSRAFKTKVREGLPAGEHTIIASAQISSERPETNKDNNTDSTSGTLIISSSGSAPAPQGGNEGQVGGALYREPTSGSGSGSSGGSSSGSGSGTQEGQFNSQFGQNSAVTLKVAKSAKSSSTVKQGDVVKYQVTVQNTGTEIAKDVKAYDKLRVNGKPSSADEFSWELGNILIGESVTIDYEVSIEPNAELGTYTNTAYASGFDSQNRTVLSNDAMAVVTVVQGTANSQQSTNNSSSGSGGTGGENGEGESTGASQQSTINSQQEDNEATSTSGAVGGPAKVQESNNQTNHSAPQNVTIRNTDGTIRTNTNSTHGQAKITRVIPIAGMIPAQAQEVRDQPKNTNGSTQEVALNSLDKVLGEQVARENHYGFLMWLWMILLILLFVVGYLAWKEQRKLHNF